MLEVLVKLITSSVMPITGFFVIRNISGSSERFKSFRSVIIILILSLCNFAIYDVDYKALITILNFCIIMFGYKILFKFSFFDSLILCVTLMIFVFISEMLLCVSILPFSSYTLRDYRVSLILGNLLVGIISTLLSRIKYFKILVNKLLEKLEIYTKLKTIIFSILWICLVSTFCYTIFNASTNTTTFCISVFAVIVFVAFMFNYFKDANRYITLNEKFDSLYDYIQTMEDCINNEQLNVHEYKNQLSVISSMTNNKKIQEYINSLIENNKMLSDVKRGQLKNLPKGGLKGLLYYKFAQAESKGLNIIVDISKNCYSSLKEFSLEDTKELSRLIGIYFDNAIEASINTIDKNIFFELYVINDSINIVISNSIDSSIDLEKINKEGYTSKGYGRGRGLYLASKIIAKNKKIKANTSIINNCFVQKLIIDN